MRPDIVVVLPPPLVVAADVFRNTRVNEHITQPFENATRNGANFRSGTVSGGTVTARTDDVSQSRFTGPDRFVSRCGWGMLKSKTFCPSRRTSTRCVEEVL